MRAAKYLVSKRKSHAAETPSKASVGSGGALSRGDAGQQSFVSRQSISTHASFIAGRARRQSKASGGGGLSQKQLVDLWIELLGARYAERVDVSEDAPPAPPPPLRKGVCLQPLVDAWDEMTLPQAHRDGFLAHHTEAQQGFGVSTLKQDQVHEEATRVSDIRKRTLAVFKAISLREEQVKSLSHTLAACPPKLITHDAVDVRKEHDSYVVALAKVVQSLRKATVDVLEALKAWRETVQTSRPFAYRNSVYVEKMRTDLAFLPNNAAAMRFLKPEVINSPLLCSVGRMQAQHGQRAARVGAAGELRRGLPAKLVEAAEVLRAELALGRAGEGSVLGTRDALLFDSSLGGGGGGADVGGEDSEDASPRRGSAVISTRLGARVSIHGIQNLARSVRDADGTASSARASQVLPLLSTRASIASESRVHPGDASHVGPSQVLLDMDDNSAVHTPAAEDPPDNAQPMPLAALLTASLQSPDGGGVSGADYIDRIERTETLESGALGLDMTIPVGPREDEESASPPSAHGDDDDRLDDGASAAAEATRLHEQWEAKRHTAARAIQVLLYNGRIAPAARRRRRRALAGDETPARGYVEDAERAGRRVVERMRTEHVAAARVQIFYQLAIKAQQARTIHMIRAEETRRRRAAAVVTYWMAHFKALAPQRRERAAVLARYRVRREWEAAAVARYDAAHPRLRRLGRGYLARLALLRAKREWWRRERERQRALVHATLLMWVYRRRYRERRAAHAASVTRAQRRSRRDVAALTIETWWRMCSARMRCLALRAASALDEDETKRRAARTIVRALRVNVARRDLQRRRAARAAAMQPQLEAELHDVAARRIYWWWVGRRVYNETRATLRLRQRWREDYIQKVSERYRSIMTNNKMNAAVLARVVTARWDALREWICNPADDDNDAWSSDPDEEALGHEFDVNTILENQLIPMGEHCRRLRVLLWAAMACDPSGAKKLSDAAARCVERFLLGGTVVVVPVVAQPTPTLQLPMLDLSLVARHEDNAGQIVLNNLLRLPHGLLNEVLLSIYNGQPPPIKEKWMVIVFTTRIMSDWGAHAVVGYLDDVPCGDEGDSDAPRLLELLLGDLRLNSSQDLLAVLKRDPFFLLECHDKLSDLAVRIINDVFPTHHDDWMCWVYEMGCLQVLSVLTPECVARCAACLGVPIASSRDEQEHLVARQTVTFKASA